MHQIIHRSLTILSVICLLTLCILIVTYPASAGINKWTILLEGASGVSSLAIDPLTPTTLYAGTGEGVYKSTNRGGNWTWDPISGPPFVVYFMAIDPLTPTTLYVGGTDHYADFLLKSINGGIDWSYITNGDSWLDALAIDPLTPTTLYQASSGYPGARVYKSTNGGGDWSLASTGLAASKVYSLAIDPLTPATLYAGTDVGVYKSTNGGGNWSLANTGLPASKVNSLVIDPLAPTTLYAGTDAGVYKSTNGGGNWSQMNGIADVKFLAIKPTRPTIIYAAAGGVFEWNPALTQIPSSVLLLLLGD